MRKVTKLIAPSPTLCQVSDQPKAGPVASQATPETVAPATVHGEPAPRATASLKRAKQAKPSLYGELKRFLNCDRWNVANRGDPAMRPSELDGEPVGGVALDSPVQVSNKRTPASPAKFSD